MLLELDQPKFQVIGPCCREDSLVLAMMLQKSNLILWPRCAEASDPHSPYPSNKFCSTAAGGKGCWNHPKSRWSDSSVLSPEERHEAIRGRLAATPPLRRPSALDGRTATGQRLESEAGLADLWCWLSLLCWGDGGVRWVAQCSWVAFLETAVSSHLGEGTGGFSCGSSSFHDR